MIRLENTRMIKGWMINPLDETDCNFANIPYESPSKQIARVVRGELKDELPPLLYERYCILRLSPSHEWVEGVGKVIKISSIEVLLMFICEGE